MSVQAISIVLGSSLPYRVNYQKFLAPFEPSQKTYRVGNDMSSLLAHKHDIIAPKKVSISR